MLDGTECKRGKWVSTSGAVDVNVLIYHWMI